MKKNLLFAMLIALVVGAFAQDTTIVQTLDFNDITKRRGWYVFPSDTNSWEKVLMYYTLKCDPQTTQDGYDCGEWDYTTYTNLYQHENAETPYYQVNGSYPDSIPYVNNPTYTYYQSYQYFIVYDNVISQTDYTVGTGSTPLTHTFSTSNKTGRAQYLWRAAELTGAGLGAGNIDKLKLDFSALGGNLNYLKVRIRHTGLTALNTDSYEKDGFTDVYEFNTVIPATGINDLNFTTPFNWDGSSNIVIDLSFTNASTSTDHTVTGETTAYNSAVYATEDDGALDFEWGDYVQIPSTAFNNVDSFITVSFWQYGDTATQPLNNYTFEGKDANGYRVNNVHLPWSNSNVYWDAGNSGTNSYDRINTGANFNDFAGEWNHWAFTKNVATGDMKIYLNGSLWHSGTGKTRVMTGISDFKIAGRAGYSGRYDGFMHDFAVFNVDLDSTTIQTWMYKDIDPSHPNYGDLQAYYTFDDMTGTTLTDDSPNGNDGTLMGLPSWYQIKGADLYRKLAAAPERPNVTFTQGNYATHLDSVLVTDSVMNSPVSIVESFPTINFANTGITQTTIDTTYGWLAGWVYTYDPYGNVFDSTWVSPDGTHYNQYKQTTFQLQNYVTPYGIGLSLGPNGFRWVYDVTDYVTILQDTVEISAGNQQELIDLKFVFIKGTPPRDVKKIESIWLGDYQHKDIANDVVMKAVDIDLDPTASQWRIKTRTTGHWFGGFQNCAEFCPKYHHVKVDGVKEFEWLNWKECADNPVIDQGGTWIYDRAGWCPGTFATTYDHELTPHVTPGSTVSLDYGMEVTPAGMEGNYRTTMQLVTYGAPNFTLDAAVDGIIAPTNWEFHNRVNPICADPVIRIKNTGSTTLTALTITYNVKGGTSETYNWTGSLDFLETEEVTLPITSQGFWTTSSPKDIFEVTVSAPNGGTDGYANNNFAESEFDKPNVTDGSFFIWFRTNSAAFENSYTIKDDQGNVVHNNPPLSANTIYNDTLNLPDGCYLFELTDSDDDGLEFFANNDGNGWIRFRDIGNAGITKTFNPNFGRFLKYYFVVDNSISANLQEYEDIREINIYPNPSSEIFNVDLFGFMEGDINLTVYNSVGGEVFNSSWKTNTGQLSTKIDLNNYKNGIYFVKVTANNDYIIKKIVKN